MVIPADWKEVRLGEYATFFKGNGLSKAQLTYDGAQPCIHYGELFTEYGPVIESVNSRCVPFGGSFMSEYGDVLMPGSDVTPNGLATASAVNVSGVALGGDVIVIRPRAKSLHGSFLSYLIRISKGAILRLVKGSTVYHIHAKDLSDFEFVLPPIDEQEAIAEALSDADAYVESLDALIAKKRDMKQAAMQQLLTGRTRLPGFTEDWKEVRLGDLGSFSKGRGITKSEVLEQGLPCIRYGEIYTKHHNHIRAFSSHISMTSAEQSCRLTQGDILFAGSGETSEEIGKCVAYLGSFEAYAGGDIIILSPRGVSSLFLGYALNGQQVVNQKQLLGQGDAVVHIYVTGLSSVRVPCPPIDEQEVIAEALSDMDSEIEGIVAQREKAELIKQGMMQELLSGRVRLV